MSTLKKIALPALLFIGISVLFFSCKKETTTTTANTNKAALSALFTQLQPAVQTFKVAAGQSQQIRGGSGTIVSFQASSFIRSNGQVVSSDSVTIKLQEMLTAGQMILANKATTSNGQLLQSGGQIYLKAYLNGEELFVNPQARPTIQIPVSSPSAMNVFYGNCSQDTSVATDTTINWNPVDTTSNTTVTTTTDSTLNGGYYYTFPTDSFTWINCDYFYGSGQTLADVTVITPETFTNENTQVFIYFQSINSVAYAYGYSGNTFIYGGGAPVGMSIKAVVVAHLGTQYYYTIVPATVNSGGTTINATPVAASLAEINAAVSAL